MVRRLDTARLSAADAAVVDGLAPLFEAMLGEAPAQARRLASRWLSSRRRTRAAWAALASGSAADALAMAERVHLADTGPLRNFLCANPSGTLLTTIHMGDYMHAVLRILSLVSGRRIVIPRRRESTEEEHRMFSKLEELGHKVITVHEGPASALEMVRTLRDGGIVVALMDLPRRWGATAAVKLFERQMQWVCGPIQIALHAHSRLLPFFCFESSVGAHCDALPVRDFSADVGVRKEALRVEMGLIAAQAEVYIRRHPEQWHHWSLLPEMMVPTEAQL